MTLSVYLPGGYDSERKYILSVLLGEFLGFPFRTIRHDGPDVLISADGLKSVVLPDVLFRMPDSVWLRHPSLPILPLARWGPCASGDVPVIYGRPKEDPDSGGNGGVYIPIDIFGSCFFMLSRYEEVVSPERDPHDRFPGEASIAFKAGFLDRPIVDEYVGILWAAMKRLWPRLERRPLRPRTRVTCDVDTPYSRSAKSPGLALRTMAGDLLKRKNPAQALRTGRNALWSLWGDYRFDPADTFDWIMDVNEKAGNRVSFYFLAGGETGLDGCYSLRERRIRALMRRIHERGHEIGLHGSYETYLDPSRHREEAGALRKALEAEGIDAGEIGNRQHYLRWRTPETARNLEKAGLRYDTTLGYADRPGFRCGTCVPYPMYDLKERKPLRLLQYPLALMEGTVIRDVYLGMGHTGEALGLMLDLKGKALRHGGEFTLLWHNSCLESDAARSMYRELVAG